MISVSKKWLIKQHINILQSDFNISINVEEEDNLKDFDDELIIIRYHLRVTPIDESRLREIINSFEMEYRSLKMGYIRWERVEYDIIDNSYQFSKSVT